MVSTFQPTTPSAAVEGLPQVFDPAEAAGVEAVVLFDLSGREPGQWTVVIKDNECRVLTGRTIEPTVTLTMDSDLWLAIARGEKSGRDAFMNGEYQVTGDVAFMMRFGKIFPVRHFADALIGSFFQLSGSGLHTNDLLVLGAWGVGGIAVGIRFFQWEPRT